MDKYEFGRMLKEQRIKKDMSKQELAKKIGVTERAISYWERGDRAISLYEADKVLYEIGISLRIGK